MFAQLIPRPSDAIITLAGGQAGRGYPMDVVDWLAGACAIAGRDLTLDGWTRYLPRRYEHSCSDLVDRECDLGTAHVHRPTSLPNHSCSPPAAEPSRRLLSSLIRDPSHLIH